MTGQERENLINSLIVDNNTQQISPAKLREVLKVINDAIKVTDLSSVTALKPLILNPFNNQFLIPEATEDADGYLRAEDYSVFKRGSIAPANLFKFIQKGFGNTAITPEAGDIYCGWSNDGTIRYTEALYISGSLDNSDNFTPLVQTSIT